MGANTPDVNHNLTDVKKVITQSVADISEAQKVRAAANADCKAARERCEQQGIHREALDMAMRYAKWDPERRKGFDLAYEIVRETIGLPIQADLFDLQPVGNAAKKAAKEAAKSAKAAKGGEGQPAAAGSTEPTSH